MLSDNQFATRIGDAMLSQLVAAPRHLVRHGDNCPDESRGRLTLDA
jgi:hypothetical protein